MIRSIAPGLLLVLSLLCNGELFAEPHVGLSKGQPERLGIFVDADLTCPFERDELLDIVRGELANWSVRAKAFEAEELYLKVIVSCKKEKESKMAELNPMASYDFNILVDFVIAESRGLMRPWQGIYGAYGTGRSGGILQSAGEQVRSAMVDYADSNLSLARP